MLDATTGATLSSTQDDLGPAGRILVSPDGATLLVAHEGGFRVWDVRNDAIPRTFVEGSVPLCFSSDGRRIVGADAKGEHLCAWDLTEGGGIMTSKADPRAIDLAPSARATHLDLTRCMHWSVGPDFGRLYREPFGCGVARPGSVGTCLDVTRDGRLGLYADSRGTFWGEIATMRAAGEVPARGEVSSAAISPDGRTIAIAQRDCTVLLWPSGLAHEMLPSQSLSQSFRDLGEEDPALGRAAIDALVSRVSDVVEFLSDRWGMLPTSSQVQTDLVASLDSDDCAEREAASSFLERLGDAAEETLCEATRESISPEAHGRVEALLEALDAPWPMRSGDLLRRYRGVEVLERIDSDGARRLLERVARGPTLAPETAWARDALARLGQKD